MPDPVVVEPPQSATPSADAPAPASTPEIHPQVPSLIKRLFDTVEDEPKKPDPEPKTPEAKPKEPKPAADPKPAPVAPKAGDPTPAPADPGVRLRKPKLNRPELPIAAPTPAPAPVMPQTDKPDPAWEAGLDETQREILEDARDAEKRFPDRHKGLAARTAQFLKDDAAQRKSPDFDPDGAEYRAFVERSQPKLSRQEIRELEEGRVAERVGKQWEGKYTDLKHEIFVRDAEPKIETEGRQIFTDLSRSALPDEIMEAIKKDGYEKARETYGLELDTAQEILTAITEDLKEFKRLSTKDPATNRYLAAEATNPQDPKYPVHQRLNLMVTNVCEGFKTQAPAEQQLKNGKWFVTRDEWNSIVPEKRHLFWTFTNAEIAGRAQGMAKHIVGQKIQERRGAFEKYGWQRPAAKAQPATPPKPEPAPVATNTPRVPAPSPMPGGNDPMPDIDARTKALAAQLNRG